MLETNLKMTASEELIAWLLAQELSLALTTYQAGKLFVLGVNHAQRLSVVERSFDRCMGLCAHENSLYMSSLYQLWRFENALLPQQNYRTYDRVYIPQVAYTTGELDTHDVAVTDEQQIVFVNTLYSCVATVSSTHSFKVLWQPEFIGQLVAEDRCHLNGLALENGQPAYLTAAAATNQRLAWRDYRNKGGIVLEYSSARIIAGGLTMPHSPRCYQGKLWLLNSGTGEFGYMELNSGRFIPVCFCEGYLRGLAFHHQFAIVGLSKPRDNQTLNGLELDRRLQAAQLQPSCGLDIIDLNRGEIVHRLRFENLVTELYDVVILPKVRCPMVVGLKNYEIQRLLTIE